MFLVLSIIFTVTIVLGIKVSTGEGMVFNSVKKWLENKVSDKVFKWIIDCPFCMPSLYSLFGYFFTFLFLKTYNFEWLYFYIITVCAASFISGVMWTGLEYLNEKHYYYNSKNNFHDKIKK